MIGYCRWKGGGQGRPYWEGTIWVKTWRKSGSRPCDWLGEECQAEARANGKALRQNCVQQCYRNSKELSAANEVREIGTHYTGPCGSFWGLWVRRRALREFWEWCDLTFFFNIFAAVLRIDWRAKQRLATTLIKLETPSEKTQDEKWLGSVWFPGCWDVEYKRSHCWFQSFGLNICKFGVAIIYDVVSTSLLGRSGSWLRALKLCHS